MAARRALAVAESRAFRRSGRLIVTRAMSSPSREVSTGSLMPGRVRDRPPRREEAAPRGGLATTRMRNELGVLRQHAGHLRPADRALTLSGLRAVRQLFDLALEVTLLAALHAVAVVGLSHAQLLSPPRAHLRLRGGPPWRTAQSCHLPPRRCGFVATERCRKGVFRPVRGHSPR